MKQSAAVQIVLPELVQLFRNACAEEKGRLDSAELRELHWALGRWFRGPQNPPPGEGQQGLGEGTVVGDDGRDGKRRTRRQTRDGTEAKSHPPDSHSRILAFLDRMPLDGGMRKWAKEIIIGQPVGNWRNNIMARLGQLWTLVDTLTAKNNNGRGVSCAECGAPALFGKNVHHRGTAVRVKRGGEGLYFVVLGLVVCFLMGPQNFFGFLANKYFWMIVGIFVVALGFSGAADTM